MNVRAIRSLPTDLDVEETSRSLDHRKSELLRNKVQQSSAVGTLMKVRILAEQENNSKTEIDEYGAKPYKNIKNLG